MRLGDYIGVTINTISEEDYQRFQEINSSILKCVTLSAELNQILQKYCDTNSFNVYTLEKFIKLSTELRLHSSNAKIKAEELKFSLDKKSGD